MFKVGNALFPLLEVNPNLQVYAFDFARSAIDLMVSSELYRGHNESYQKLLNDSKSFRVYGDVHDIANEDLPLEDNSMDLVLCMFVLSAISYEKQAGIFRRMCRVLKPGGKLLIRDYGRYDEAQLRFSGKNKIEENFYVRQDGTCAYYFTTEEIDELATSAGFECEENEYITRQYANRKQVKARYRVWIHCKYKKLGETYD